MADDGHTEESLAETLGALGPGGIAAIRFEDYKRLFGSEPSEDQIEGERAARFAKDNGCRHEIDPVGKRVVFRKQADAGQTASRRQSDPGPGQR